MYKLKLLKKLKIDNVFYISLLEQNITKKKQINNNKIIFEFESSNYKKYEIDDI